MSNENDKKLWYEIGVIRLAGIITAITIISTALLYLINYFSTFNSDFTKLVLTVLNLLFSLLFCLSLSKTKELKFIDDKKERYWKLLDIESYSEESKLKVEVGNKKYDAIERATFNETRVNKLIHQFTRHIFWFALILVIVYLTFTLDNDLLLGDTLSIYQPYLKIFEDLSNFGNSIFIFLGFMVLYDITIDKKNREMNYYMPILVVTFLFLFVYTFLVAIPTIKYANSADNILVKIKEEIKEEQNFEIINTVKELTNKKFKNESEKEESVNIIDSSVGSIISLENQKLKETDQAEQKNVLTEKLNKILNIIKNESPNKITINIILLIIGSFNGLTFALLFGRYISMEHQLWKVKKGNYNNFIKWGIVIILPMYALAQPLFGSFNINAFGSPKNFANVVFFICLIGKAFFFYVTWLFIEKRLMHYYLHLVLVNHGVPKDFDSCFEKDE